MNVGRASTKRCLRVCPQMYYSGQGRGSHSSSPVYCLAYDSSRLYLALDRALHMLDFQLGRPRQPQAHV